MASKKKKPAKPTSDPIGLSNKSHLEAEEINLLDVKDESFVPSEQLKNLHALGVAAEASKTKDMELFEIDDRIASTTDRLIVRETPSTSSKKLFDVKLGTQFVPVSKFEGWYRVLTLDPRPRQGYVSDIFVEKV